MRSPGAVPRVGSGAAIQFKIVVESESNGWRRWSIRTRQHDLRRKDVVPLKISYSQVYYKVKFTNFVLFSTREIFPQFVSSAAANQREKTQEAVSTRNYMVVIVGFDPVVSFNRRR